MQNERSSERKKGEKPTREEYNHRVEIATQLLSRRVIKGDIKRIMMGKFGVSARSIEDYLSRAREVLKSRLEVAPNDNTISSLAFYESIVVGTDTTMQQKMSAQDKIDWVLGVGPQFTRGGSRSIGEDGQLIDEQRVYIVREVVEHRNQVIPIEIEG